MGGSSEPNVHRTAPAASGGERADTSSSPHLCAGTESTMERTESGSFSCTESTMERTESGYITATEEQIERSKAYWSALAEGESGEPEVDNVEVSIEEQIELSKVHWSTLSEPGESGEQQSELSRGLWTEIRREPEVDNVAEVDNVEVFKTLKSHRTWGSFFQTFYGGDEGELELGKKFAEGGQADLYYAYWRINPGDRGKRSILEEHIEISKAHWTQLEDGDEDEEAAKERIKEEEAAMVSNKQVFKELQEKKWGETFFYEFEEGELVMAEKFAEGGQAEVYHAQIKWRSGISQKLFLRNKNVLEDQNEYVLKVFKKGTLLEDLKETLPEAMLNFQKKRLNAYGTRRYICDVVCATLLKDGRFAFVLQREDNDLRKLIERDLKASHGEGGGPFPKKVAENFMYEVAKGMEWLHGEGIVHRDLKAANVLVKESRWNYCFVADYECSVGTIGTGFHRAPEILKALKAGKFNARERPELFTKAADVYGYGMTCYEILTGKLPFQGHSNFDVVLIHKQRPELPKQVDAWIRELLNRCWQFDPQDRLSFGDILNTLRKNSATIQHRENRTHPKACHWSHPKTEVIPIAELKKIISNKRKEQIQHPEEMKAQVNWRSQFDNEYEPRNALQCEWVLKVCKGYLEHVQLQIPEGLMELHADRCQRAKTQGPSPAWEKPRYICDVLCATLLQDGRFAFMMQREHGDLRMLIDLKVHPEDKHYGPPFSMEVAVRMMQDIACGMDWLHSYNVIHRDLKASNVLVTEDASGNYQCFVADYECSVGVVGTRFFRAPEVIQACMDSMVSQKPEVFSRMADVYSYGMLCYEILTAKLPFEHHPLSIYLLEVLIVNQGLRPEVPEYVADWLHELLKRCWQPDPAARPSFWQIQKLFETAEEDRMERLDEILGKAGFS